MGYRDRALTRCGTPETLVPEVVDHKPYTRAVDWWSFGVIFYQLSTGKVSAGAGAEPWKVKGSCTGVQGENRQPSGGVG